MKVFIFNFINFLLHNMLWIIDKLYAQIFANVQSSFARVEDGQEVIIFR